MFSNCHKALCALFFWVLNFSSAIVHKETGRRNVDGNSTFYPTSYALGNEPISNVKPFQAFQLSSLTPMATLDYGHEVAGVPIFEVESVSGKVQIEVKFSEEFAGLDAVYSDGPFLFATALSNTYRVETFEIITPGHLESFFIQGGQRWQSIRLITKSTVEFSSVGFKASISNVAADNLPGSFSCDDELLNSIWKLGASAVSTACIEANSQKALWEVSHKGALVRGMRPAVTVKGAAFSDYTLEHDVWIERAGTGWAVALPIELSSTGLQLDLVGELSANTTFVNTNKSLTPPNSIILAYGYSFVNQTTINSFYLDTFEVPFSVHEKIWYTIKTTLSGGGYLSVSLNNTEVFNTSLSEYYVGRGSTIPTKGSFGFGGWQDQSAYVKNVAAYDTATGALLYSNSMTDSPLLGEYGVHENYNSLCLDGAKRDRLGWLGDLFHTVKIVSSSTSRFDMVKATIQWFLDWQTTDGLFPFAAPPICYTPLVASQAFSGGSIDLYSIELVDYQILGLIAFCDYIGKSNDLEFARTTWPKWQLQVEWILSNINATTGLVSFNGFAILGPANDGSVSSCSLYQALNQVADVATAINQTASATTYRTAAQKLGAAINARLWNPTLGVFSWGSDYPNDYSTAGLGFCLLSGVANKTQAALSISALSALKLGPGYKDNTQVNFTGSAVNISPFTNGFILSALLSQNSTNTSAASLELMKSLWGAMLASNLTSSGASWEYVNKSLEPGLGLFTSLSHPWGGAPTYLLTEWAAGLRQAAGVPGFGYRNWIVDPSVGISMGLKKARASVVTAFAGNLELSWRLDEGNLNVVVHSPSGTKGTFMGLGSIEKLGTKSIQGQTDVYEVSLLLK